MKYSYSVRLPAHTSIFQAEITATIGAPRKILVALSKVIILFESHAVSDPYEEVVAQNYFKELFSLIPRHITDIS